MTCQFARSVERSTGCDTSPGDFSNLQDGGTVPRVRAGEVFQPVVESIPIGIELGIRRIGITEAVRAFPFVRKAVSVCVNPKAQPEKDFVVGGVDISGERFLIERDAVGAFALRLASCREFQRDFHRLPGRELAGKTGREAIADQSLVIPVPNGDGIVVKFLPARRGSLVSGLRSGGDVVRLQIGGAWIE